MLKIIYLLKIVPSSLSINELMLKIAAHLETCGRRRLFYYLKQIIFNLKNIFLSY
jgi:hypothetical protein